MLVRAGIGDEIIAVIRQFYDGAQACVGMDDGELYAWFKGIQGRRQGCLSSMLLSTPFFAAVLELVLVRLNEGDTIFKSMISLDEATGRGAETPLERVRRAGGKTICRRHRCLEIHRRPDEDDIRYHGRVRGLRTVGAVKGDGDSIDESTGKLVEKGEPPTTRPPPHAVEAAGRKYTRTCAF